MICGSAPARASTTTVGRCLSGCPTNVSAIGYPAISAGKSRKPASKCWDIVRRSTCGSTTTRRTIRVYQCPIPETAKPILRRLVPRGRSRRSSPWPRTGKIRPPKRPNPPPLHPVANLPRWKVLSPDIRTGWLWPRPKWSSAKWVNSRLCCFSDPAAWAKPICSKAFGPPPEKAPAIYRPCIFRPSNSPAIFSRPCEAAACPVSAANTAAWDC